MKVLFVSSGNSVKGISPIVSRQGESLKNRSVEIHFFTIIGKGFKGYLANLKKLKAIIKEFNPDIIHAHYSMSAYLATLAYAKPLVVSLMGSDVKSSVFSKFLIKLFNRLFWAHLIVKSEDMRQHLDISGVSVIPNGVDTNVFYSMDKASCQEQLKWDLGAIHILFAAKPTRPVKNVALAQQAYKLLNNKNATLHVLNDVSPELIPIWMNAADIVMLTSLWEGSPNVIKEAMACNRPIVATNVGDIKWLFGNEPGHFLADFESKDVAEKLKLAIEYRENNGATKGRERIIELGLDSETIAQKIIEVYNSVLQKKINENIF